MAFNGYFFKFGSTILPNEYIAWEGANSAPDQRTEAEAWTNANNELVRSTYSKYRSKIEFNTRENLTDLDIANIFTIMHESLLNEVEQKYSINYWDDKTGGYKTGNFYLVDPQFQYKYIDNEGRLHYKSIKFSFVEY